ncbi:hypothetical protein EV193_104349 [Herbihabitans rhizosphaerae]|uniref:Terminase small subunit n=1 Tax=Herbihabitans rhizosphaerae TaxID=1872711 RepID=A0A4V2ESX9_9PSEU|nr:hypothetical protein [Herbihabitans rhizosphaerae]RZS39133.1 hypothetical protein EV193_104349 [Herbihabitans rhizosphaerae]
MAKPSGPAPKRSDQRRRRNTPASGPATAVTVRGSVEVPPLDLEDAHPFAEAFYTALAESGQSWRYEPSDWARARVFIKLLSDTLKSGKPSSMMYQALQRDMDALLVSEPDRLRAGIEINRDGGDTSQHDAEVTQMDAYREALGG